MSWHRWKTVYWNRSAEADADEVVELDVAALEMAEPPVLLEHEHGLIVRSGPTLHRSDDLGETWRELDGPWPGTRKAEPDATVVALDHDLSFLLPQPGRVQASCVGGRGSRVAAFSLPSEMLPARATSRSAAGGVFFSCSDGGSPLLRWTVRAGWRSDADDSRRRLRARIDDLRGSFGVHDPEVWLLEDAYVRSFQCNVCSDELHDRFVRFRDRAYDGVHDPGRFSDDGVEYRCLHCGSRVRQRTARIVLDRDVLRRRGCVLLVGVDAHEHAWLARRYRPVMAGDSTQLPHVEADAYDLVFATAGRDDVPAVAGQAYRVLGSGGELLFFVDGFELADAVRSVRRAGFLVDAIPVLDPLSRTTQFSVVARKPVPPPPWRRLCAPVRGVGAVEAAP